MLIIHPEATVTTVTKTLFRLACLPALLCSMQLQAQAITLEASTMTGALLIPVTTDAASLAQPAAGKLSVTQAGDALQSWVKTGYQPVPGLSINKPATSNWPDTLPAANFNPAPEQFPPSFALPGRFDIGYRALSETDPALLSTVRLRVSSIEGVWSPSGVDWELSAALTDPADERLFKSLSDLTAMSGVTLRQAPARHWWLGIRRRF